MHYPNHPNKHTEPAMVTPDGYISYLKGLGRSIQGPLPEAVILCYSKGLERYLHEAHPMTPVAGAPSPLHYLNETNNRVAVTGRFGIGAPAAVVVLEELIACGIKKFLTIGTAGSLQKTLKIGELVLCERAIRDEGTSHHYLEVQKYSYPSESLTQKLAATIESQGLEFQRGTTWTIDAPYRETVAEAARYQAEGVLTVEMEASALFAVAQYRGVEMGSILTISDSLADLVWKPEFHSPMTQESLERIFRVSLHVLEN